MRNLILLFVISFLFTNCQSTKNDILDVEENADKAEAFKKGDGIGEGIIFVTLEANSPSYSPTYIIEAMQFIDPEATKQENAYKLNDYLEKRIIKDKKQLDLIERVDHELISYMNLSFNILEMEENNSELAAKTLIRVLKYTKNPIEWRILTNALISGRSSMKNADFQRYKTMLQSRISEFMNNTPSLYDGDVEELKYRFRNAKDRLLMEAKDASFRLSKT